MKERILNTEEANYRSNLNVEHLKKRIEDLFEQSTLRLTGKLTSENEFTAYDKTVVIGWDMPHLKRKAAYLKGKISQGEKGTLIKLKVNPNSVLPVFAVLATTIGLIVTLMTVSNVEGNSFFFILGLVLVALGLVYYPLSTFFRNRLRDRIVKHLDLNRI